MFLNIENILVFFRKLKMIPNSKGVATKTDFNERKTVKTEIPCQYNY